MKRLLAVSVIPVFAGFLCAQEPQTTTTTTTTTYNGTLVDEGCQTTKRTERKETTSDENKTTTKTTVTTENLDCPVTTTTTSFGLITPDGKYVRFDEPSNARVIQVVKSHKDWVQFMNDRKPIKVRVIGKPNGDVVVIESIK